MTAVVTIEVARPGDAVPETFTFERSRLTLGRNPLCDVPLRDPTAGLGHAELRVEPTHVLYVDLGQPGGSHLAGEPLPPHQAVLLPPDAVITIGTTSIRIRLGSGDREESVPAAPATFTEALQEPAALRAQGVAVARGRATAMIRAATRAALPAVASLPAPAGPRRGSVPPPASSPSFPDAPPSAAVLRAATPSSPAPPRGPERLTPGREGEAAIAELRPLLARRGEVEAAIEATVRQRLADTPSAGKRVLLAAMDRELALGREDWFRALAADEGVELQHPLAVRLAILDRFLQFVKVVTGLPLVLSTEAAEAFLIRLSTVLDALAHVILGVRQAMALIEDTVPRGEGRATTTADPLGHVRSEKGLLGWLLDTSPGTEARVDDLRHGTALLMGRFSSLLGAMWRAVGLVHADLSPMAIDRALASERRAGWRRVFTWGLFRDGFRWRRFLVHHALLDPANDGLWARLMGGSFARGIAAFAGAPTPNGKGGS